MPIRNRFSEMLPEITEWRRWMHENPELLFETVETGKFVAEKLREFGCDEVVTGLAKTGVVGVIKGKTPGSRTVGLRADMDALPITEATGVDYASKNPGVMHACGHDGHTAMLLGAAKYLCETRNFTGDVVVIFQPAEEGGGGAKVMIDEGLMERFKIDEVYGLHNWPNAEAGSFHIRSGAFLASADEFSVEINGKGGHAAEPHNTIDTTVVAAHIILALQTIVSRNVDPVKHAVVTVSTIESDSKAHNVIANRIELSGTVRTLDREIRDMIETRMAEVIEATAQAFGATAKLHYKRGYPVLVNTPDETDYAAQSAKTVAGECEENAALVMGAEDFAFMLEARPGAYITMGIGEASALHTPGYNFNDDAIPAGCSWWVDLAESRLNAS